MPSGHIVVETPVIDTVRKKQLEGIFELPPQKNIKHEWTVSLDYEKQDWNVGLIVGPSGSGKTQILKKFFPEALDRVIDFKEPSVIDDFDQKLPIKEIASVCQAVGFNTIPSWLKPYAVLSNGEKFRVELAMRLLADDEIIAVDEFTSFVDRQVAKIASHAVQKYIRKKDKKFLGVTCHYDVVDWLQPDWIYQTTDHEFRWRLLQCRPKIECTISPVPYSAWPIFAPFHYMSKNLHRAAACFGLFMGGQLAAFAGIINRPISRWTTTKKIWGISRLVTLPDYQGLGLAFVLSDFIGSIYKARGHLLRSYPAHPALIRSFDRSRNWKIIKAPKIINRNVTSRHASLKNTFGGRPNAIFQYAGPAAKAEDAERVFRYWEDQHHIGRFARKSGRASPA